MTSRREFLKVGLAASALPMASAIAGDAPPAVELYRVLYDTRFPASVAFARRASSHGVAVAAMHGDVTRFWYDDLYPRWREAPVAIAGLTAYGALFCLERLAWDHRMRVVFRGEHVAAGDGCVAHALHGAPATLRPEGLAAARDEWAAELAECVVSCPPGGSAPEPAAALAARAHADGAGEPLFSWVIAPPARA